MRLLIAGAGGQLGHELARACRATGHAVTAAGRDVLDVADLAAVRRVVERERPEVIVNAAAMTDVDGCENDPDAAYRVNALGSRNLAVAAREADAMLVQVGTDHVFDGEKGGPYTEFDPVNPVNVYGRSKLAGEETVRAAAPRSLVVRTAWLYSGRGKKDFVRTVLSLLAAGRELRMVEDQIGSPTYVPDLAQAILVLVEAGARGVYHLAGAGECSRLGFARVIAALAGHDPEMIRPARTADFPSRPARRPRRTPLRAYIWELEGRPPLRDWSDALRECLERGAGYAGN